jgi:hypothetical protein
MPTQRTSYVSTNISPPHVDSKGSDDNNEVSLESSEDEELALALQVCVCVCVCVPLSI